MSDFVVHFLIGFWEKWTTTNDPKAHHFFGLHPNLSNKALRASKSSPFGEKLPNQSPMLLTF
jgi:hypothetical protein